MQVTDDMLEEFVAYRKIVHELQKLFQLSDKDLLNPNAPDWIIDVIKQYQTSFIIAKSMKMQSNKNQTVENYHPLPSMPIKPIGDIESGE